MIRFDTDCYVVFVHERFLGALRWTCAGCFNTLDNARSFVNNNNGGDYIIRYRWFTDNGAWARFSEVLS